MNGTFRENLTKVRGTVDSLPGIVEALGKLPGILRAMPPAPVITGALSRMAGDAIAGELRRRGPSVRLCTICEAHGLDPLVAAEIFETLVDEVRA
jgi:hypothetical protein